jgi:thioesterase domain-containing protein
MASEYVDAILAAAPHRPTVVGGSSFGALVAFEMARQLDQRGAPPAAVVLVDPALPGVADRRVLPALAGLWRRARAGRSHRQDRAERRERWLANAALRRAVDHAAVVRDAYEPGRYGGAVVVAVSREYRARFGRRSGLESFVDGPIEAVRLPAATHRSWARGASGTRMAELLTRVLHANTSGSGVRSATARRSR